MEYFLKYHSKLISRASGVAQAYIIIHDLLALLTLSFNVQDIYIGLIQRFSILRYKVVEISIKYMKKC